ncbi:hypothetical protein Misp01_71590 [Microtetraspora sp. NBRC 13810]|uniref:Flp pilus assembly protein CpaB n=1 Tax=Microtetraspora sp. NBRC 13810 TaxID=3030990 RepID=UPI0024A14E4C|nr:Flp pilus assembly protein CpaB [Microtetraspora sp. NBRC 13810]GLW12031.1 hypothetical protein Misp01_71590 [Microtetraspora sp. NBRC 13810]
MRALSRALTRRRRLVAAALTALAAGCALTALAPGPGPTVTVLTAARDLTAGVLRADDVRPVALPESAVPDGALRPGDRVAGRMLATPVRRGEPLTDLRLLGPALLASHPRGTVATPIRIADAEAARLLSAGDVVDVLAAPTGWEDAGVAAVPAQTVADDVTVISAPPAAEPSALAPSKPDTGALVVLATTSDQAARLASAQSGGRLSITLGTP